MITIYGIKNCDTMKKAFGWLDDNQLDYTFHDYKKKGIERKLLTAWSKQVGWQVLLNKRGTTFRKLPEDVRHSINQSSAIDAMLKQPSMIKRPVLSCPVPSNAHQLLVGFNAAEYESTLLQQ